MSVQLLVGDCRERLRELEAGSVQTCVTSPPYFGLRDYGHDGQIGLEQTPGAFVAELAAVFREVRRVLRDDGTLWLNLGDSYSGSGKGGNPEPGKQATNRGSESVGVTYGKTGETARQAAVTNVTRYVDGVPPKNLIGIPWRVAFALQADGWYLRQDIIWAKPNPMPESVTDRCTKAHEYLFLLSKGARYHFDAEAISEAAVAQDLGAMDGGAQRMPDGSTANDGRNYRAGNKSLKNSFAREGKLSPGEHGQKPQFREDREPIAYEGRRNKRSVWTVATTPFKEAHFATYPPELIEPCILAGCPAGGTVLDPFGGAGTTGLVADRLQRNAILIELNPAYAEIARKRLEGDAGMFAQVEAA